MSRVFVLVREKSGDYNGKKVKILLKHKIIF